MKTVNVFLGILFLLVFTFIMGCSPNSAVIVKNAKQKDIWNKLTQYIGMKGYQITYADEAAGTMRVVTKVVGFASGGQGYAVGEATQYATEVYCSQKAEDVILQLKGNYYYGNQEMIQGFLESLHKDYTIEQYNGN